MRSKAAALLTTLVALAGCIGDRVTTVDSRPPPTDGGDGRLSESFIQGQSKVDVLFVIDNSSGMAQAQDALVKGIGAFIGRLELARADWRLGVISSDLGVSPFTGPGCMALGGDGAELQNLARQPGCTPPKARYITRSNVKDPAAAFACIAVLGEGGCGFEQPLAATLRAIDPTQAPAVNKGFLRDEALLMVVWVSNEDDCSAEDARLYDPDNVTLGPYASYRCFAHGVTCSGSGAGGVLTGCASSGKLLLTVPTALARLRTLKPLGSLVLVALVGPPTPVKIEGAGASKKVGPSCASSVVQAKPAIRFAELLKAFGADGVQASICGADLGLSLAQATTRLKTSTGPHCLRHALKDPARPGCMVAVQATGGGGWIVPPSSQGAPGFRLVHPLIPGCLHGALDFDAAARPPAGAKVTMTCDFVSAP
jgi:hypothetical protein